MMTKKVIKSNIILSEKIKNYKAKLIEKQYHLILNHMKQRAIQDFLTSANY